MSALAPRRQLAVLQRVDVWLVLAILLLCLCGLVFIGSATQDDPQFQDQQGRQALFLTIGCGLGLFLMLPHYVHVLRAAWPLYAAVVLALLGLPFLAPEINGARRWYALPGFLVQPSEFAKLAVVLALAAWLRFRNHGGFYGGLLMPLGIAALPALLVLRQPDLGSSLVFAPVALAMCYCGGVRLWRIVVVVSLVALVGLLAWFELLHDYQKLRIDVWLQHWRWDDGDLQSREVQEVLRGPGFQPWQALIAMGSGGLVGHGIGQGPQNRYDFLPYRSEDYVFAVVAEETGWLGCALVLALVAAITLRLLVIAGRTRERFGRLVCVGVATWLGAQSLLHVAICCWLLPAKGLPMPLLSYGGSSTVAMLLGLWLCCSIGARRETILGGDGYR
jgi:rod shape determining protein RodA